MARSNTLRNVVNRQTRLWYWQHLTQSRSFISPICSFAHIAEGAVLDVGNWPTVLQALKSAPDCYKSETRFGIFNEKTEVLVGGYGQAIVRSSYTQKIFRRPKLLLGSIIEAFDPYSISAPFSGTAYEVRRLQFKNTISITLERRIRPRRFYTRFVFNGEKHEKIMKIGQLVERGSTLGFVAQNEKKYPLSFVCPVQLLIANPTLSPRMPLYVDLERAELFLPFSLDPINVLFWGVQ